ncbi:unnamed protein product [Closterium sp. NIES-64]|nr:unnamed protein product [Closterium sp. NIES-64]
MVAHDMASRAALTSLFHRSISTGSRVMYIGDDSLGLVGLIGGRLGAGGAQLWSAARLLPVSLPPSHTEQVPTFEARPGSFQGFFVPPASFLSSHLPISLPPSRSPPPRTPQSRCSHLEHAQAPSKASSSPLLIPLAPPLFLHSSPLSPSDSSGRVLTFGACPG